MSSSPPRGSLSPLAQTDTMSSPPPREPSSPPKQTSQVDDQTHPAPLNELPWEEFEARIARNYKETQRAIAEQDAMLAALDAPQQPSTQQPQQRKRAGSASGPDNQKIPRKGSDAAVTSGENDEATGADDDSDWGSACEGSIPSNKDQGSSMEPFYRDMPPLNWWPIGESPPYIRPTGSTKSDPSEDQAEDPFQRTREASARLQAVLREGQEQERASEAAGSERDPYDSVTTISQESTPPPAQPQVEPEN